MQQQRLNACCVDIKGVKMQEQGLQGSHCSSSSTPAAAAATAAARVAGGPGTAWSAVSE
jgi:hypothetical protein